MTATASAQVPGAGDVRRDALDPGFDRGGGSAGPAHAPARWDRRRLAWAAVGAGAAASLGPLLMEFGRRLWAEDHYQFFPLLLAAAGWLGLRRFRAAAPAGLTPGGPVGRAAAWTAAGAVAAAAAAAESPFAACLAALSLLLAAFYELGGARLVRVLAPVWGLLWIVIPPPFGWDREMVVGLQRVATGFASGLLDLAHVRHLADGVVIRLSGSEFFVDEGCSGIHSLFASLTFAAVVALSAGHGPLRAAVLLAATVAWVILANAGRVFAVVVLSSRYGLPVVDGAGHEAVGLLVFAGLVALVLSTERLLRFLVPLPAGAAGEEARPRPVARAGEPAAAESPSGPPRVRGLVAVAAALLGLGAVEFAAGAAAPPAPPAPPAPKAVAAEALPAEWNGWKRADFDVRRRSALDPAGEWSRVWTFRKGGVTAAVSLDGPYSEWHDLGVCYTGAGYRIDSYRHIVPDAAGVPSGSAYTALTLGRPGRHARAFFAAYSFSDRPVPPSPAPSRRLANILEGRFARFLGSGPAREPVYQVQVFAEAWLPISPAEERELLALFEEMRGRIAAARPAEGGGRAGVAGGVGGAADRRAGGTP